MSDWKPMDDVQIAEIEARERAATPGPWSDMNDTTFHGEIRTCETFTLIASMPELDDRPEDFCFIAHARADVPQLIAEIRNYREAAKGQMILVGHARAATEMLWALKRAKELLQIGRQFCQSEDFDMAVEYDGSTADRTGFDMDCENAIDQADIAIRKAEGR